MGPGLSASFESIIASLQSSAATEDSSRSDFRTIRGAYAIAEQYPIDGVVNIQLDGGRIQEDGFYDDWLVPFGLPGGFGGLLD